MALTIGADYAHCCFIGETRGDGVDGAFPGYFPGYLLLCVSRGTFVTYCPFSGCIDRQSSRHSLNPIVMSPSPADRRIARCSSVSILRKALVSVRHGLPIVLTNLRVIPIRV